MVPLLVLLCFSLSLAVVEGAPSAPAEVTPLTADQVDELIPFIQFSRAAYCGTGNLVDWSCGEACNANIDFEPTLVGGDGNAVQFYFVGFSPSQNAIVVGHEGTDPVQLESDLTDLNIVQSPLDANLFPGVTPDVEVHEGFRDEQARTANDILNEVRRLLSDRGTNNIVTTGHSLGGALALLDALFLTLNIPEADVSSVTFGMPRVGNPAFAALFDSKVTNLRRVNHAQGMFSHYASEGTQSRSGPHRLNSHCAWTKLGICTPRGRDPYDQRR